MLLFDIIRDWFVQYIWGGVNSAGTVFDCTMFRTFWQSYDDGYSENVGTGTSLFNISRFYDINNGVVNYEYGLISMGDWLSTTSTIIVMILLCVVFGLMVRWLFRLTAGLLRGN